MIGAPFGIGYSCTIANDGDATSRGSAPSSAAIARTRNVFPAPRSPMRCTVASRGRRCAISRPAAIVSDSAGQMNRLDRIRQFLGEIVGRESGVAHLLFQQIAREAVQINRGARGVERIVATREERGDDAAEDV